MRVSRPARQGEGALSDAIREALALEPGLLVRRNSQCAVVKSNRMVRGGLGNGSADLPCVLLMACTIPAIGRAVELEIKMPGKIPTATDRARIHAKLATRPPRKLTKDEQRILDQDAYLESVRAVGGFGAYVDSVESARDAIARARTGARS